MSPVSDPNGKKNLAREGLFFCKACCETAVEEFGEGTAIVIILGHPKVNELILHGGGLDTPSEMLAMMLNATIDFHAELSGKE
jgi:hypothetical protein